MKWHPRPFFGKCRSIRASWLLSLLHVLISIGQSVSKSSCFAMMRSELVMAADLILLMLTEAIKHCLLCPRRSSFISSLTAMVTGWHVLDHNSHANHSGLAEKEENDEALFSQSHIDACCSPT